MHCEVHSADSSIFSWPNRVSFALTFSEHSGLKHFSSCSCSNYYNERGPLLVVVSSIVRLNFAAYIAFLQSAGEKQLCC